ncbi:nitrogen fixation protein NifQ [Parathalassolituus penaei]|uniref:Nitrogen fixation protein NifQ n=1 Tax=Parathalassolituus penaei TaxID=2997323 RepID=A0A9X3EDR2_9GAMM|nr:nitrogen fixation protein NifQ [Parathalassolituus penaei]MCY0965325.1 nitrogen fixation protein NifQ [Parathalassolituus penaei]
MNLGMSLSTFWPQLPTFAGRFGLDWQAEQQRMQERAHQQQQNREWLIRIVGSQRQGRTCLPVCLGLQPADFAWLTSNVLPMYGRYQPLKPGRLAQVQQQSGEDLRQQLLEMREDEWLEIRNLLRRFRRGMDDLELVLADVLAAGCLGGDHLWRDLGLADRGQLSELMRTNFPDLFERNNANMKWKKFFYKQLCEEGGGYVCRAPSCQECTAYRDCFGPEA